LLSLTGCAVTNHERNLSFSWDSVTGATFYRLNRNGIDLARVTNTACTSAVTTGDVFFVRAFNETTNSGPSDLIRP
jgi:hypothetical protein